MSVSWKGTNRRRSTEKRCWRVGNRWKRVLRRSTIQGQIIRMWFWVEIPEEMDRRKKSPTMSSKSPVGLSRMNFKRRTPKADGSTEAHG